MRNVYLIKDGDIIRHFLDESEMKAAGYTKADKTVTEEKFNSNGCYARIVEGDIVIGKTKAEKAEAEKQQQISSLQSQLVVIDNESGASRSVRDVSVSAGVAMDAYRILMLAFAEKLGIALPDGFGEDLTTAAEMLALAPPEAATDEEKAEFAIHKALLLVSHYDPAINQGLQKLQEAEARAKPVRAQLEPLLEV